MAEPFEGPEPRYGTTISEPDNLRGLVVEEPLGATGPGVIPCATCHDPSMRENPPLPTSAEEASAVGGPHAGFRFDHGDLSCAACHSEEDRSALHLADGTSLPLTEAMQLCRQCHGPQSRDYDHGSHGGMRGHWDLSEGPRERNHCVSCHDPHGPAFGRFMPRPAPRDRFLGTNGHGGEHADGSESAEEDGHE